MSENKLRSDNKLATVLKNLSDLDIETKRSTDEMTPKEVQKTIGFMKKRINTIKSVIADLEKEQASFEKYLINRAELEAVLEKQIRAMHSDQEYQGGFVWDLPDSSLRNLIMTDTGLSTITNNRY
jgi:DNA polymerase III delta prime subunit